MAWSDQPLPSLPISETSSQKTGPIWNFLNGVSAYISPPTTIHMENSWCFPCHSSNSLSGNDNKCTQLLFTTSRPDWVWRRIWSWVSHCRTPRKCWYLTAWKEYLLSENTWEPESNLKHAALLLTKYKNSHHLSLLEHALHLPIWHTISIPHTQRHPLDPWTYCTNSSSSNSTTSLSNMLNSFLLLHHSRLFHPQLNSGSGVSLWVPVTIFFLSHVFFLVSVVCHPYFRFTPQYEKTNHYLLAFTSSSSPLFLLL